MPRCDHVVFRVADLERTLAFYERLVPAKLVSRRQHEDRWRSEIATLHPEDQDAFALVFIEARRVSWLLRLFHALVPRQMRSFEHVGFVCGTREELERREQLARELGARVINPVTKLDGREGWVFELADPDGNAVEWTCGVVHD